MSPDNEIPQPLQAIVPSLSKEFSHETPSVLVIDDSPEIGELIRCVLEAKNIRTEVALSGAEGVELAKKVHVDLVLLDMGLPDQSGLDVCRTFKNTDSLRDIPILIITGLDTIEDKVRGFEAGASDFITKPFALAEVEARILAALRQKHSHDDLIVANRRERQRTQEELLRISKAMDSASDAVCIVDPDGKPIYTNMAFTGMFSRTVEDLAEHRAQQEIFVHPEMWHNIWETCRSGKSWSGEVELLSATGEQITALCRGSAIFGEGPGFLGAVFLFTDITQRKRLEQDLLYLANHDPLTALHNRRYFAELIGETIEAAKRGSSSFLLYIDLDNFKVVNDSAGHQAGDRCLKEIAKLLRSNIRPIDQIGRFGGDEFTVLLHDITESEALKLARHLISVLDDYRFVEQGRSYSTSASIGIAAIDPTVTAEDLFARADATCYLVKSKGRNDCDLYHQNNKQIKELDTQANWSIRIKDALREGRIEIWLQPILPLRGQTTPYFEVLVRMRDENGQIVLPGEFLPAAEHFGNMQQLDQCVIREAFTLLREHPELQLAINLSAKTLTDPGLPAYIEGLLRRSVNSSHVSFEITETAMIQNLSEARQLIAKIKSFGCRFALDDFGSGASSMLYLRDLPIDYLKIDGSFIKNIATDSINRALVKSMNEVAHIVGKQTVAEYVTNAEVLRIVQELGIDYAQGWYVCPPAPPQEFFAREAGSPLAIA